MQWREFRDNLGDLKIEGLGYHAPTDLVRINKFPTNVYVVTSDYHSKPWIAVMGFVWSLRKIMK